MIAMLLAAGRGERLRPITDHMPKPLVEVRGTSLIERHLRALADAGATTVVINLGWLGEQIAERIGSGVRYGVHVLYSDERDNILETAGGIRRALPLLGSDPFLVVNADIYTDLRLPCEMPLETEVAHLVLVPTPDFKSRGEPRYTFSGVAIYRPAFFADLEEGRRPLAPLLKAAADKGRIGASLYQGVWADVGTPERLAALNDEA